MIKKINGEEFYSPDNGMTWEKLTNIPRSESLPFRHVMHYVGKDARIGDGVNLLLDYVFDVANGTGIEDPEDAQYLLQQLGYTIEEIQNVNKK